MTTAQRKPAQRRRRPMTREEARAREERRQHQQEMEQQSRELAKGPIDLPFCLLVLLLTAIGLVMLLSASFPSAYYETQKDGGTAQPAYYFIRQAIFAVMGVAAMFFIGKINYQRFRGVAKPLLFVSIILLMLVLVPHVGITRNNATRWLGFGSLFTFQPSEIAKVAVVLYFSNSISKKKDKMRTFRYGILPYALILIVLALLLALEPHLSGAILILGVGAVLMLVGGCGSGHGSAVFHPVRHRLQHLPHHLLAGPLGGRPGRRLSAVPEPDHHWLRRSAGRGPGQEPPEIFVPARGAQRLHLRHHL